MRKVVPLVTCFIRQGEGTDRKIERALETSNLCIRFITFLWEFNEVIKLVIALGKEGDWT